MSDPKGSDPEGSDPFEFLPDELLFKIFLSVDTAGSVRLVSRHFCKIWKDPHLWYQRALLESDLPTKFYPPSTENPIKWYIRMRTIFTRDATAAIHLLEACRQGDFPSITYLLPLVENLGPALVAAAGAGRVKVLQYLISRGIVDTVDEAFRMACQNGRINTVRYLLGKVTEDIDYVACYYAAYKYGHQNVVRFFLEHDDELDVDLEEVLLNAVRDDNSEMVDLILEYAFHFTESALRVAVEESCPTVLPILLSRNPNNIGEAFELALDHDDDKILEIVAEGIDVNKVVLEKYGLDNLTDAVRLLQFTDVKELLQHVIEENKFEILKFICENSPPSASLSKSIRRWCRKKGYTEAEQYLAEIN